MTHRPVASSENRAVLHIPLLVRLDESAHALRLVERDLPSMSAFRPESVSVVDEDDLWTPLIHTAA